MVIRNILCTFTEDMKNETEEERQQPGLCVAWQKYKEFEEYSHYDHAISLVDFVVEWEERLAGARATGSHYSDQVLAFKLLEKANLNYTTVEELIATLGSYSIFFSVLTIRSNFHRAVWYGM